MSFGKRNPGDSEESVSGKHKDGVGKNDAQVASCGYSISRSQRLGG